MALNIPQNLLARVMNGESIELLENYLMNNYTYPTIIKAFSELIITAENAINRPQIPVSQAEYEQIMGLFRIRGVKMVDGEMVTERRGRPRKVVRDDNENVLSAKTIFNEDNEE